MEAPLLAVANVIVAVMLIGLVFLLIRLKMGPAPDETRHDENMEDGGY
jgi:hypothetical protein